jgi:hypothetical protein
MEWNGKANENENEKRKHNDNPSRPSSSPSKVGYVWQSNIVNGAKTTDTHLWTDVQQRLEWKTEEKENFNPTLGFISLYYWREAGSSYKCSTAFDNFVPLRFSGDTNWPWKWSYCVKTGSTYSHDYWTTNDETTLVFFHRHNPSKYTLWHIRDAAETCLTLMPTGSKWGVKMTNPGSQKTLLLAWSQGHTSPGMALSHSTNLSNMLYWALEKRIQLQVHSIWS